MEQLRSAICRCCEEPIGPGQFDTRCTSYGPLCKLCVDAMHGPIVNLLADDERSALLRSVIDAKAQLEQQFAEDMRHWARLVVLLERARAAAHAGNAIEFLEHVKSGLDAEFHLMNDCETFGHVSDAIDPDSYYSDQPTWWRLDRLRHQRQRRQQQSEAKEKEENGTRSQ